MAPLLIFALALLAFDFLPVIAMTFLYFAWRRLVRYLHYFQQEEYDNVRFIKWWWQNVAVDRRATAALITIVLSYNIARLAYAHDDHIMSGLYLLIVILLHILPVFLFLIARAEPNPAKAAKKPLVYTLRANRILWLAFALLVVPAFLLVSQGPTLSTFAGYIVLAQSLPFVLIVANILLVPYEKWVQLKFRREAEEKLKRMAPKIIGITGSFGKTSTKTILAHILSSVAPTLATPGSVNTLMGITRIIREQLKPEHQFFIVEMGAYGPKSIPKLCAFTPPVLSAITAVGAAHYERYKTIDQVAKAKFAIADAAWANNGVAVINATQVDQKYLDQYIAQPARARIITNVPQAAAFYLHDIAQTPTGLQFKLQLPSGETAVFQTPLFGTQHAANCAVAVVLALECGVPLSTIQMALVSTPQTKHRLEVKQGLLPYTMIDDAYNSNATGFAAALDVLDLLGKHQKGKRVLITPGMVELGALHDAEHMRLGLIAANKADWIIAVAPQRMKTFGLAVKQAETNIRYDEVPSLDAARALIEGQLGANDVVLYENDLPDLYETKPQF